MCRAQSRGVFLDEGLEDTVDVRANSLAISCAWVLDVDCSGWRDCCNESNAKYKREKGETEDPQSRGCDLLEL